VEPSLERIYSNQVQPRGSVRAGSAGGSFGAVYERDPHFRKLENSVFSQINELTKEFEEPTYIPDYKKADLKVVSIEDAMKELLELEKSINAENSPIF
jgi:hypothetical protein